MRVEGEAVISNESGLHARPCHAMVALALEHASGLQVSCGEREVNGKSILELMTLGASKGMTLSFCAEGSDAEALVAALVSLVESGFSGTS
ncbi:phosphocarrier protein HPr [Candidatus Woesearchaeota archaeon]|jgi:phosphotransferase system HPr (HPr) family protein|nr:phosphocarrier protein HPr [Candidatus Woesearchaeota archaeon]MDP6739731.1 HPr family phosphocarrier protein [Planctomycetota bacterium]MDP6937656.1 HPr family phosphocarrier protein [Planctomycetota bacterium]